MGNRSSTPPQVEERQTLKPWKTSSDTVFDFHYEPDDKATTPLFVSSTIYDLMPLREFKEVFRSMIAHMSQNKEPNDKALSAGSRVLGHVRMITRITACTQLLPSENKDGSLLMESLWRLLQLKRSNAHFQAETGLTILWLAKAGSLQHSVSLSDLHLEYFRKVHPERLGFEEFDLHKALIAFLTSKLMSIADTYRQPPNQGNRAAPISMKSQFGSLETEIVDYIGWIGTNCQPLSSGMGGFELMKLMIHFMDCFFLNSKGFTTKTKPRLSVGMMTLVDGIENNTDTFWVMSTTLGLFTVVEKGRKKWKSDKMKFLKELESEGLENCIELQIRRRRTDGNAARAERGEAMMKMINQRGVNIPIFLN
ncbi:hypothetical protein BLNAU_12557 [Blattamonas nauphoetae]|uniref:Uncharacterized protein n=1 Tax=Blattamonas nauphoetae TaxID=2049346 RepID=A0ABQ9XQD6_9EUKA|nr:hypothetical protein BLNAU_12557 [Blattamonas nauphoetae]